MGSRSGEAHQTGHPPPGGEVQAGVPPVPGRAQRESRGSDQQKVSSHTPGSPSGEDEGGGQPNRDQHCRLQLLQRNSSVSKIFSIPPLFPTKCPRMTNESALVHFLLLLQLSLQRPGGREAPCFPLVRLCRLWKSVLGFLVAGGFGRTDPPPWQISMLLQHSRRGHVSHPLVDTNFGKETYPTAITIRASRGTLLPAGAALQVHLVVCWERWLECCSFHTRLHTGSLPVFARLSGCGGDGDTDPQRWGWALSLNHTSLHAN
ncbi:hypothetical protein B0T14DRAFT_70306 [Immersiella caudata]|uniref:Uncharacterized protein n=1 Tax=Immersiella caudata TaxID=314043 RepID=A0AA39XGC5_9PEZI|nr:hypothetical protein B0T14DRAFT_70306 [Immersiella caudata]